MQNRDSFSNAWSRYQAVQGLADGDPSTACLAIEVGSAVEVIECFKSQEGKAAEAAGHQPCFPLAPQALENLCVDDLGKSDRSPILEQGDAAGGLRCVRRVDDINPHARVDNDQARPSRPVSYTHLRAHETDSY